MDNLILDHMIRQQVDGGLYSSGVWMLVLLFGMREADGH